jgi:hypothetical protein
MKLGRAEYWSRGQRVRSKPRRWPSTVALSICAGCSLFTESDARADGDYSLVALDGRALPVPYAEITSTDGSPTGCWANLTEGQLKLVAIDGAFRMSSVYRNSCTGQVLWEGNTRGSFSQTGTTLSFVVQDVGHTISFAGVGWRDSVRVDFVDPVDGSRWINHFVKTR